MGANDGTKAIANFAQATLTAGIDNAVTSLTVTSGGGAAFPTISSSPSFYLVIWNATDYTNPADDPNKEIMLCAGHSAASDTFSSLSRGQLGTSAATHNTTGKTYKIMISFVDGNLKELAAGQGAFAVDSGAANAYVTTITTYPSTLANGMELVMKVTNTSTGASTLNHNGTGAKNVVFPDGTAVAAGDLVAGNFCIFRYDSSNDVWMLVSGPGNTGMTVDFMSDRVFFPRIPDGTTVTPADRTVVALYLGRTTRNVTINYVEAMLTGNYTSITDSEVGLFSTPLAPNRTNQTLTKLGTATITGLTSGAPKTVRNGSAMGTVVPAGTFLWAAIRIDYSTLGSGAWASVCHDFGEGNILSVVSATTMASATTYAGTIPADANGQLGQTLHASID